MRYKIKDHWIDRLLGVLEEFSIYTIVLILGVIIGYVWASIVYNEYIVSFLINNSF